MATTFDVMNKPHLTERELPAKFSRVLEVDWFRRWTLKERLQILVGYNVAVCIRIACRHSAGAIRPFVRAETTKQLHPSDLLKTQMANALIEANEQ